MNSSRASNDTVNERSPLVSPSEQNFDNDEVDTQPLTQCLDLEETTTDSKSSWYLFLLTLSIGGLQIVWSVELSNGSPYLLSLGMSKALLAFVWIAGPLSGVLVQPYVGIRSDNCRISWGKRKPFMIGGGIATILSLLLLAWIRDIIGGFLGLFGVARDSSGAMGTIIFFGTLAMCILDFSINTVQAGIRAFIVDNAPAHQQEIANAWASRIIGVGNVLGYVFGYIDLPRHFPIFGNTQFKVLCVIASLSLAFTLAISCLYIKERDPRLEGPPKNDNPGLLAFFKQVFKSVSRLSPQIRKVCEVQFFSWIAWFPFLFYITTYIGQLYVNPFLAPDLSNADLEKLWEQATRIGTFALLIYAIVSLLANFILPFVVEPIYATQQVPNKSSESRTPVSPTLSQRSRASSLGALPFSASTANLATYTLSDSQSSGSGAFYSRHLAKLRIPNLTLRRTWILSQLFFGICMFTTFFISTPTAATVMTAFIGISWSVTLWIPFALISAEVAQQDEMRRKRLSHARRAIGRRFQEENASRRPDIESGLDTPPPRPASAIAPAPTSTSTPADHADDTYEDNTASKPTEALLHPHAETAANGEPDPDEQLDQDQNQDQDQDQAGMILGLHNVAVSAPQMLSTLISSIVFRALQKPRGVPGDQSIGWVLRFGGLAALVAAWWGKGLAERTGLD